MKYHSKLMTGLLQTRRRDNHSCAVLKTVLRDSDRSARLLNVQDPPCGGHWQVDYFRPCNNPCTGEGDWTYSDSFASMYCEGYAYDFEACDTHNCREEFTCYNNQSAGCY